MIDDTQRIINALGEQFTGAVTAGRGKLNADLFDGRCFLGPEALTTGLVDALATSFDATIRAIIIDALNGLDAGANLNIQPATRATSPRKPLTRHQAGKAWDASSSIRSQWPSRVTYVEYQASVMAGL